MPTVVPVKFKYSARDLWFDPRETGVVEADHVICHTERGLEIGMATADPFQISDEEYQQTAGDAELRAVERVADEDDLQRAEMLADKGDAAFGTFRELVHESGLDMKPVGVEYPFGGGKIVCYFSAEDRVDFRKLVRDLARELHEHVDMRQIGVREEAAIIGGWGHCGQELCCARFGRQFEPVSIRMAKEQDLPLNSSKISGACGRLMCCLRYEFEAYRDFKQRAPKRNAVISTPLGKAKIVEYDTPKEQLALRLENGKVIRVPLSGMTASDAAQKKSKELGCPCRPDTVGRDILERLNSPDVQMALAELDRQNGVIPPEPVFHESDLFVDTSAHRHKRRHSDGADAASQGGKQSANREQQAQGQGAPRHRRRRAQETQEASKESSSRRVVRRTVESSSAEAAPEGKAQTTARHRRRRHHEGTSGQTAQVARPETARESRSSSTNRSGEGRPHTAEGSSQDATQKTRSARRRRHPGDHGGQARSGAQNQQKPQAHEAKGQKTQAPSQAQKNAAAGAKRPATKDAEQSASAPRRRRRHHRGSGGASGQEGRQSKQS